MKTAGLDLACLLNSLSFPNTPGGKPPAPGLRGRPAMETLEPRLLLSAQTVIGFEDLYPGSQSETIPIPAGYAGLNWSGSCAGITSQAAPGSGYEHGTIGQVSMYTAASEPVTFSATSGTFYFAGCYITAAWVSNESVTVQGFNGGNLVDSQVVTTGTTSAQWFDFNYANVDSVTITPADSQLDIDNITLGAAVPAPVVTAPSNQTAVAGESDIIDFGSFSQAGGAGPWTVTANWGDGTANGVYPDGIQGYIGWAHHTYAEEGNYTATISVTDGDNQTGSAQFNVGVSDPAVVATGGYSVTGVEGAPTGLQTVATFADPAGAESLDNYSATINWGDGTATSAGTITYQEDVGTSGGGGLPPGGVFTVQGNHTYAEESATGTPYVVTVTVSHDQASDAVATSSATVSDPAVVVTGSFSVTGSEGTATGPQTVATFTDPGLAEPLGSYAATINWGDGTATSAGTITYRSGLTGDEFGNPQPNGVFTVKGSHTYADNGTYVVSVTVSHELASNAVGTSGATIGNAAPVITSVSSTSASGQAGSSQTCSLAAAFTDAGVLDTHTATVDWGDGTTAAGAVTESHGSGTVAGSHKYLAAGVYTVTVTVKDNGNLTDADTTVSMIRGAAIHNGILEIVGTDAADKITLTPTKGYTTTVTAGFLPGGRQAFSRNDYQSIHIWALGGNDTVTVSLVDTAAAILDGGDGNDVLRAGGAVTTLIGGNGNDTLWGGSGACILLGGAGNDVLHAGSGADVLVGGAGSNTLVGGAGRDILIGGSGPSTMTAGGRDSILIAGTTLYDADTTALAALSAEWNSSAAWSLRVSHLTSGGGLNGADTLAGSHVIGNALVDTLKGNTGHNWFFRVSGTGGDVLAWLKGTDLVTNLK